MLTNKQVSSLDSKKNSYYKWDNTSERGKGRLGVQVTPAGTKVFKFRYFVNEKPHFIKIGTYPLISLSKAREQAKLYSLMLDKGLEPKVEIERQQQADREQRIEKEKQQKAEDQKATVKDLFESHRDKKKAEGKRQADLDLETLEKEVYPYIAPTTKARDVTTEDIVCILRGIINRGAKSKSNKVRGILHAAFKYGLTHDHDPAKKSTIGKFDLLLNPVSAIPIQKDAEKVGDHFLEPEELFKLLHDLEHRTHDLKIHQHSRDIMRLCFYLGGQRPNEVCNIKWRDVNEQNMTLTLPSEVTKNKRDLVIALTKSSYTLLTKNQHLSESEYIFPKTTDLSRPTPLNTISQAVGRYRDRAGIRAFTARDFRRTFKTLAGRLNISKELRDRIQGHAMNDVSSKHYDRYDYLAEKREAMKVWCDFLADGIERYANDHLDL
ncbi:integrase [Vibrio ishigakensis]|uniref:Integrase n=1 Tax=Vibrio ishigakensis TaxID=1481914 RepID=A0A0B8P9V9_9VIBR|nr:integrase [Vibrio ishigakensis]